MRIKLFPDNPELRVSGVIIEMGTSFRLNSNDRFPIARVMWNTGLEWIDATRLEIVNGRI